MSPRVIVDTGALYALADRNDRWHRRLTSFLESESADLVVPITVLVDSSVAAVAERLRVRQILTTDRRHFSLFRPRHCPAFELLP